MTTPSDLVFPGTHNSGAYQLQGYPSIVKKWTLNQALTLGQQLHSGIRYLNLDITWKDQFWISHRFLTIPLHQALDEIISFILVKPQVILLELTVEDSRIPELAQFLADHLSFVVTSYDPWKVPIDRLYSIGKTVLLSTDNLQLKSELQKLHLFAKLVVDTPWIDTSNYETKAVGLRNQIRQATGDYHLGWTLSPQVSDIVTSILPCRKSGLQSLAESMNGQLSQFIDSLSLEDQKKISVITVDFCELSDVVLTCQRLQSLH